jgi:hypothetical protein
VDFPYEPYDCQRKFMQKVINSLQHVGFWGWIWWELLVFELKCLQFGKLWLFWSLESVNTRLYGWEFIFWVEFCGF